MLRLNSNFPVLHGGSNLCSLGCNKEKESEHLINCKYLIDEMDDPSILADVDFKDIFGSIKEQQQISSIYYDLIKIRDNLLNECRQASPVVQPGHRTHACCTT